MTARTANASLLGLLAALGVFGCSEIPPLVPAIDFGPPPDSPDMIVDTPDIDLDASLPDGDPRTDLEVDRATPRPEVCDSVDNDLDGRLDEIEAAPCQGGTGLCAYVGETRCVDGELICTGEGADPTPERCNAIDDDCDGTVDEDFAGLGEACGAGVGVCREVGEVVCLADGSGARCDAHEIRGSRTREICDGLDNDCDGMLDEVEGADPSARITDSCVDVNEAGICGSGSRECIAAEGDGGAAWTECDFNERTNERCNNLDDDCDGNTDESFAQVGDACDLAPVDPPPPVACPQRGVVACTPDGTRAACRPPPERTCDGIDENCDGVVDDGLGCGEALTDACRAWLGWTQQDIGDVVEMWGRCPDGADWSDTLSCNGAPAAGSPFAEIAIGGDVDTDGDYLGVSWRCDGGDPIAAFAQRSCRIYLGAGPADGAPADPSPTWGPCPGEVVGTQDAVSCTSGDGQFRPMPPPVDIDQDAVLSVAFRCTPVDDAGVLPDGMEPAPTAARLEQSVEIFIAWADADVAGGEIDWEAACAPGGDGNSATTCVSSGGDGLFHSLRFISDLDSQDRLAIGLRPRAIR